MTARFKTLDEALATSPDPVAPSGLAGRIAARATAEPQGGVNGAAHPRVHKSRQRPTRRRFRRPMVLGSIGGGLIAVSAVATALVADDPLNLSRIADPVMGLFGFAPTERVETVERPELPVRSTPARAAERAAVEASAVDGGGRPEREARSSARRAWLLRRIRRARLAASMAGGDGPSEIAAAPVVRERPRGLAGGSIGNRPVRQAIRTGIRQRAANATPEQRAAFRDRLRDARERRQQNTNGAAGSAAGQSSPSAPIRISPDTGDMRADRLRAARARALENEAAQQGAISAPTVTRSDLIVENTPPGREPAALPSPSSETPQTGQVQSVDRPVPPAVRDAAQQRRIQRRQQLRRRLQRGDRPRPNRDRQRPRIPRPRR